MYNEMRDASMYCTSTHDSVIIMYLNVNAQSNYCQLCTHTHKEAMRALLLITSLDDFNDIL